MYLYFIEIVDIETGEELPAGKSGEIYLKGPMLMKGYLKKTQETQETFDKDGWLKSGMCILYLREHSK